MAFRIVINKSANKEALDAYLYYEEQKEGLGRRFIAELNTRYKQLETNPQHYSFISEDIENSFRSVKVKDFPYMIIYSIIGNTVKVYSVHNSYKKPRHFQ